MNVLSNLPDSEQLDLEQQRLASVIYDLSLGCITWRLRIERDVIFVS